MRLKAKKKTVKMLLFVVLLFAVCWLPLNAYHLVVDFSFAVGPSRHSSEIFFACHWLAMSSVCYNPFIYCWLNDHYRVGAKAFFSCSTKKLSTLFRFFDSEENGIASKEIKSSNSRAQNEDPVSSSSAIVCVPFKFGKKALKSSEKEATTFVDTSHNWHSKTRNKTNDLQSYCYNGSKFSVHSKRLKFKGDVIIHGNNLYEKPSPFKVNESSRNYTKDDHVNKGCCSKTLRNSGVLRNSEKNRTANYQNNFCDKNTSKHSTISILNHKSGPKNTMFTRFVLKFAEQKHPQELNFEQSPTSFGNFSQIYGNRSTGSSVYEIRGLGLENSTSYFSSSSLKNSSGETCLANDFVHKSDNFVSNSPPRIRRKRRHTFPFQSSKSKNRNRHLKYKSVSFTSRKCNMSKWRTLSLDGTLKFVNASDPVISCRKR